MTFGRKFQISITFWRLLVYCVYTLFAAHRPVSYIACNQNQSPFCTKKRVQTIAARGSAVCISTKATKKTESSAEAGKNEEKTLTTGNEFVNRDEPRVKRKLKKKRAVAPRILVKFLTSISR